MAKNDVEFKIKLIDQFGHPLSNLQKKVGNFNEAQIKASGVLNKSLSDLRTQLARYKEASEKSYRTDHIKKYKELISETKREIAELEKQTESCGEKSGGLASGFKGLTGIRIGWAAVAVAVAKAAGHTKGFGKETIDADAQMQNYNATLKTLLGTTGAARDRMQEYMDIAKKTPFDLPQVVDAGNKLQALGKYSEETLNMIGDLAAASGTQLENAMSAFSHLATGQKGAAVRMFRNLLITEEDWIKATGKGVSKNGELLATTKDMLKALPEIMKAKNYLGLMAAQAETTGGKMANLEDAIFGLKAAVGERLRPITNDFLNISSKVVDKLNSWVAIPIEQKIASEKNELNRLVDELVTNYDNETKRRDIIDELNQKYPEFLKNVNLEKDGIKGIKDELIKVNEGYNKKIKRAFYQTKYDELRTEYNDVWGKYVEQEAIIQERKNRDEWEDELRNIAKKHNIETTYKKYENYSKKYIDKNEPITVEDGELYIGGKTIFAKKHKVPLSEEEKDRVIVLEQQINASNELFGKITHADEPFGKVIWYVKQEKNELNAKAAELKTKMDYLMPYLMGEETPPPPPIPTPTPTPTPTMPDLEDTANSISSGGKSVKNFNIVINDGLIKQVDNHFGSTNENPQTASDFMWQLSQALQMMLNDVNYAAAV